MTPAVTGRRPKAFIAALVTETNVFVPDPTSLQDFIDGALHRGDGSCHDSAVGPVLRQFRHCLEREGFEVVEGLAAYAEPAGRVQQPVYEALRDEILDAARSACPDVVLLFLHGAMAAEAEDDCEGELLVRMKVLLPHAVVGVLLDPHCHLSERMVASASIIVMSQEYPHTDFESRAVRLVRLCVTVASGRLQPVSAVFDCRMLGVFPTTREPMLSFVSAMKACEERPGILAVSLCHGFAFGDTPDTGAKVLVVADSDRELGVGVARELGERFYSMRDPLRVRNPTIEQALELAERTPGRVVLADTGDNPGGGAPGDSTMLLRSMLERGMTRIVAGCFADPKAVASCAAVGVGGDIRVRIGSGQGMSGPPLELQGTVKAVVEAHDQESLGTSRESLGHSVWLRTPAADVVISSLRRQVYAPDAFTGLGIPLEEVRYVVLKSTQHFVARFAPIASRIIFVATPGALTSDYGSLPYRRMPRDRFPFVEDPLGLELGFDDKEKNIVS